MYQALSSSENGKIYSRGERRVKKGREIALLRFFPFPFQRMPLRGHSKVMLHGTICNGDFLRNTALQCWNSVAAISNNVGTMLQRCVALKKVVANRPV